MALQKLGGNFDRFSLCSKGFMGVDGVGAGVASHIPLPSPHRPTPSPVRLQNENPFKPLRHKGLHYFSPTRRASQSHATGAG